MIDSELQSLSDRELLGEILARLDRALLNQERLIKAQEGTQDVIRQIWPGLEAGAASEYAKGVEQDQSGTSL
jgi:hypothetical protein